MINFENAELFIQVVEHKSFTKAADYCEMSKATISRHIKELEENLGARLLERTTRKLTLTEVGEYFYHKAKKIINDANDIEGEITDRQTSALGKLTMYGPVIINDLCSGEIAAFRRIYPQLNLELHSTAVTQDLGVDTRFDVLIYLGEPQNSSFIAKPLAKMPVGYYATPRYLNEHGYPSEPNELINHQIIYHAMNHDDTPNWVIDGEKIAITPGILIDSPYLALSLTLESLGIAQLPHFVAQKSVSSGGLIPLFADKVPSQIPVYAIYPSRRFIPYKLKLVLEYLTDNIQKNINLNSFYEKSTINLFD